MNIASCKCFIIIHACRTNHLRSATARHAAVSAVGELLVAWGRSSSLSSVLAMFVISLCRQVIENKLSTVAISVLLVYSLTNADGGRHGKAKA